MQLVLVTLLVATLGYLPLHVSGHARLREPPSRSSMWRDGFSNPANYDDNGLNCGGLWNQWSTHGGKCGICGDPWQGPRVNEPGPDSVYANGIIVRQYTEGQTIEVKVEVTAHHKGWFEFRVCPNNDVTTPATQSCLDNYLLPLANQPGVTRYDLPVGSTVGWYPMTLQLPVGLTCEQCVFQWKYHAGNNWGCDGASCCVGCGPQEEFYGCADVKIVPSSGYTGPTPPTQESTTTTTTATTTTPASGGGGSHCRAADGPWKNVPGMDGWCVANCAAGYCPPSHCTCD